MVPFAALILVTAGLSDGGLINGRLRLHGTIAFGAKQHPYATAVINRRTDNACDIGRVVAAPLALL